MAIGDVLFRLKSSFYCLSKQIQCQFIVYLVTWEESSLFDILSNKELPGKVSAIVESLNEYAEGEVDFVGDQSQWNSIQTVFKEVFSDQGFRGFCVDNGEVLQDIFNDILREALLMSAR
ncbi:MAG: hypothetical protein OXR68_04760 [Alphaproteobacteria bacterium]|nr:hypothetical protein [Alphaproteobacteria bacterium]